MVRAAARTDSEWPIFVEKLEWSGNLTIRVIPFEAGALAGSQERVLSMLTPLGVTGEGAGTYPIVALTVPVGAERGPILHLLDQGIAEGWWGFEEGCVDDDWLAMRSS